MTIPAYLTRSYNLAIELGEKKSINLEELIRITNGVLFNLSQTDLSGYLNEENIRRNVEDHLLSLNSSQYPIDSLIELYTIFIWSSIISNSSLPKRDFHIYLAKNAHSLYKGFCLGKDGNLNEYIQTFIHPKLELNRKYN